MGPGEFKPETASGSQLLTSAPHWWGRGIMLPSSDSDPHSLPTLPNDTRNPLLLSFSRNLSQDLKLMETSTRMGWDGEVDYTFGAPASQQN